MGSNGAGKSTLFNAIAGSFVPDTGSILLDGEDITFLPDYRRSKTIGRMFQDPLRGTAPNMTIEENLALAYLRASGQTSPFSRITRADREDVYKRQLLAGLTDIAGQSGAAETDINQGAEGTLPEQTVTIESITSGSASSSGDSSSDSASSDSSSDSSASSDSSSSTDSSGSSGVSATINVTMNGTAQTMDLVTCLAMVAQNELGPNAPAEAYKAQCVATHSWILSQSGYPSVAGTTPGSAATAAAQEVANVLVTYNGQVCFTPYFASASTGTASAADVWGNSRPWLVAVDSPCLLYTSGLGQQERGLGI